MSLQDDYFDLSHALKGDQKKAFLRIWEAFAEMENEHERLLEIRASVRRMCSLAFEEENKVEL
jgi:hypothetical protein